MATLLKWSGDDVGGYDSELNSLHPNMVYDQEGDNASLLVSPSGVTMLSKNPIGSPAATSGRFSIRLSGYPEFSNPIVVPLDGAGQIAWRLRLSSTGTLIIDNAENTQVGVTAPIPLNTWALVKWQATATQISVRLYDQKRGGDLIGSEVVASSEFGLVNNFRIGQINNTPVIPPFHLDDILLTDTAEWAADPVAPAPLEGPTVAIIGDSLTAMGDGDFLYNALDGAQMPTRPVYVWGVGGKRISATDAAGKTTMQNIQDARNMLGTVDTWIIALGTNDRPQNDSAVLDSIDTVLDAIGPSGRVVWIGLTSKGAASPDDVRLNGLIQSRLAERPDSTFADWDAHIRGLDGGDPNSELWSPDDYTHMSAGGYAVRANFYVQQLDGGPYQPWDAVYIGDTLADAVYVGSELVWQP